MHMKSRVIILAIIAVALMSSGCFSGCVNDPDMRRTLFADDYDYYANSSSPAPPAGIAGAWSTGGPKVALVDPGLAADSWYGPVSGGEWYIFKDHGYFKYIKMAVSGEGNGSTLRTGKYSADGDSLSLYEINESWYPDSKLRRERPAYAYRSTGDEHFTYEMLDNNTLAIRGSSGNSTFYRLFLR